jgi:hypothetical protein
MAMGNQLISCKEHSEHFQGIFTACSGNVQCTWSQGIGFPQLPSAVTRTVDHPLGFLSLEFTFPHYADTPVNIEVCFTPVYVETHVYRDFISSHV